jgi:hypothetical protein
MREQEVRELYEAYLQVHQPQEVVEEVEQLDEAITSEKGKKKAAEMIAARSTPSGRAKKGQGANVAQIKHIGRANVDGYGGTPPNRKVAKNPVKYNFTGLNTGTGNKAARRAAELNKEAFELWVNALVEEGYDLSDYTWEEMYESYLEEARTDPRGRPASGPMSVYGGRGQDAGPGGSGNANVDRMDAAQRRVKATQPKKKGMAADALYTKYSARQKGMEHGGEEGPGPKAPKRSGRSGRGANTDRGSGNAAKRRMSEDFDLFDYILEHLVAEGYADTNENALVIMANMSEEWRQSIVEMGENIGKEPKTVGKPERPGVKGETYAERQKRMKLPPA